MCKIKGLFIFTSIIPSLNITKKGRSNIDPRQFKIRPKAMLQRSKHFLKALQMHIQNPVKRL